MFVPLFLLISIPLLLILSNVSVIFYYKSEIKFQKELTDTWMESHRAIAKMYEECDKKLHTAWDKNADLEERLEKIQELALKQ